MGIVLAKHRKRHFFGFVRYGAEFVAMLQSCARRNIDEKARRDRANREECGG
jgi:hypothetical protein